MLACASLLSVALCFMDLTLFYSTLLYPTLFYSLSLSLSLFLPLPNPVQTGTLTICESRVLWWSNDEGGGGIAIPYPIIGLHAVRLGSLYCDVH